MNFVSGMTHERYARCRKECGLSPEETAVFDGLRHEKSIVAMSIDTGMSTATVSRKIRNLKRKTALEP